MERTWPEVLTSKIRRLNEHECRQWATRLKSHGTGKAPPGSRKKEKAYSSSSINKALEAFSLALEYEREIGWIGRNVAKGLPRAAIKVEKATNLPSLADFQRFLEELQFPSNADTVRTIREAEQTNKSKSALAEEMGVSLATFKRHLKRFREGSLDTGGNNKVTVTP